MSVTTMSYRICWFSWFS